MNEIARPPPRGTTQAAEGLPRIKWTHHDLDRMVEAGLLREHDDLELIGGEIVPMSPKGSRHERIRIVLTDSMYRRLPAGLHLMNEPGWRPEPDAYFEPDILVAPASRANMEIPTAEVLLLIEIADSSWSYDSTAKRDAYARLGVRDYWIIRASDLITRVHRDPSASGYTHVDELNATHTLTPILVPEIAVRLADLRID
jgi:Uma2 family endonuclease